MLMTSLRVAVGTRKLAGGCSWLFALHAARDRRPERAGGRGDAGVADLRIEPIGVQVDVVFERHLHGIVDGETEQSLEPAELRRSRADAMMLPAAES